MSWWKKGLGLAVALIGFLAFAGWYVLMGQGERLADGRIAQTRLAKETVADRDARQAEALSQSSTRILFGDVHVHTSLSVDAFQWGLPMMGGEGVHPPADACDFARYCSQLDFFALTDHAEALTPRTWDMSRKSIRQCNAVQEGTDAPDLIAFTGFEWTQIGRTPEKHYGHKNIFFKNTADDQLPARPIASPGLAVEAFSDIRSILDTIKIPFYAFPDQKPYNDIGAHLSEIRSLKNCPDGVNTRELPADCRELAATPVDLYRKLDEWGFDSWVIPHGTAWGIYTPPGYNWDKGIAAKNDDRSYQRMVEVFSGHGNSEEYREWRSVEEKDGELICPEPQDNYEPCCWRAGEIIRSRCTDGSSADCKANVEKARQDYALAGVAGHLTIPDADLLEWGDCGQCRDCFDPAFAYRPGGSVQYMLARGNFDDPVKPRHMTMGFIASSDNHSSRPGTGYKEFARRKMTETRGPPTPGWKKVIWGEYKTKAAQSQTYSPEKLESTPAFRLLWFERQASFFLTGGLVAVHAKQRSRAGVWDAMDSRNVYGTSGDRILLWFDMLNAPQGEVPMGTELSFGEAPRFRVRAAGSFEQLPGCPDEVMSTLGKERIERVCAGECYRPSDKRRKITRVEVVRIIRQNDPAELVQELIDDPWLTIPCENEGDLCEVEFEDPQYTSMGRDALYYVRAIQEPTLAVNAAGIHCDDGKCDTCFGDFRTPFGDDCLSPNEERAWSSPIYLSAKIAD